MIKKSIMKIQTDSLPVDAVKDPNTCNIFQIYKHMANKEELDNFKDKYLAGGLSYGEAKNTLFDKFMIYFKEARSKKAKLMEKPDQIYEIRKDKIDGTVYPESSTQIAGFDTKFTYTSPRYSGSYVEVLDRIIFDGIEASLQQQATSKAKRMITKFLINLNDKISECYQANRQYHSKHIAPKNNHSCIYSI